MTFRQFNAQFRPLKKQAWILQCHITGLAPNNKTAEDRWYREQLHSITRGQIRTTKDASQKQYGIIIQQFSMLAKAKDRPTVDGWSDAQNYRFLELAKIAFLIADGPANETIAQWLHGILLSCDGLVSFDDVHYQATDRTETFDEVMAYLAIVANDEYWLLRTAEAGERRLRWQITRFLGDLDSLTKTTHDWDYVKGIWQQARQLPDDIGDAPAELLFKILQMLDTHIRRLCKDHDLRPKELPSRTHQAQHPDTIRETDHQLHVGHALEHCELVNVTPESELPL